MNEQELTEWLQSLSPAAVKVDVVSAALQAGRKQGRSEVRIWRGICAACLILCAGVWIRAIPGAQPTKATEPTVALTAHTQPMAPLSGHSALRLQEAVLEHGMDGLPQNQPASSPVVIRVDDLL